MDVASENAAPLRHAARKALRQKVTSDAAEISSPQPRMRWSEGKMPDLLATVSPGRSAAAVTHSYDRQEPPLTDSCPAQSACQVGGVATSNGRQPVRLVM